MSAREEIYDRDIAPALRDIAQKCEDSGISIVVMVEWEPGETGRTCALVEGAGFGIRMVEAATRSRGNVDSLIFSLMNYGRKHGHSSICLKLLEGSEQAPADRGGSDGAR